MNPDDLKQMLDALTNADVREFALRTGSFDLSLKRGPQAVNAAAVSPTGPASFSAPHTPAPQGPASVGTPAPVSAEPAPTPTASEPAPVTAPAASKGTPVKAPIVGTYYASSSPDAPPYIKVGDTVSAGQILCIIEAMKLMNEIEAEAGGTVREILVKNAEPVEYGQTLFIIE
ncbi:acetyl-CoA carboxylase biotin carboxyl carrier protein [Deinococcus sp.]|uniref:acetyl-CoA carboxylase biotin carboxyl carrier protein n=1 Tax=Deinococcus sp. TaxID=47478 RepID=UPI00286990B7|nr:acetyl-CoA carboxylase biotin carboxyl carrier protein [Deinococcus sp.]